MSLTLNPCDNAENNLKIIDNQPADGVKKEFGVCVKQLTYPHRDFIIRFIEWVHMLRILGNSKVHVYVRFFHPEMMKIIKHFELLGLVETYDFLEPACMSNDQLGTQNTMALEHAILNDCFYKVKNLYTYVAILDPDEIIMPANENDHSWQDLFKSFNQSFDIYPSRMIFYPEFEEMLIDGVPSYFYMLTHVQV